MNDGKIENSYFLGGSVSAADTEFNRAGGLVGCNSGTIENTFTSATLSAKQTGGLAGYLDGGTVKNSVYLQTNASAYAPFHAAGDAAKNVAAVTAEQLKSADTYANWKDFDSLWSILPGADAPNLDETPVDYPTVTTAPMGEEIRIIYRAIDAYTNKPIYKARISVNGVPRYTDRDGEITVSEYTYSWRLLVVDVKPEDSDVDYLPITRCDFTADGETVFYLKTAAYEFLPQSITAPFDGGTKDLLSEAIEFAAEGDKKLMLTAQVPTGTECKLYAGDTLLQTAANGAFTEQDFFAYTHETKFTLTVTFDGITSYKIPLMLSIAQPIVVPPTEEPDDNPGDNTDDNGTNDENTPKPKFGCFGAVASGGTIGALLSGGLASALLISRRKRTNK